MMKTRIVLFFVVMGFALGSQAQQSESLSGEVQTELLDSAVEIQPDLDLPEAQVTQPTTQVQANPMTESAAERLRKARQNAEIKTEQKIVEKLEQSRLDDEHKRAQRLFGDRIGPVSEVPVAPPAPVAPQQIIAPIPVVEIKSRDEDDIDANEIKEEVMTAVRSEMSAAELSEEAPSEGSQLYIQGSVGMVNYPGVANIQPKGGLGLSLGSKYDNGFIVEGALNYSNFYIEEQDYVFRKFDQYNFQAALMYSFLESGRFHPIVGVVGSYTTRKYSEFFNDYGYNLGGYDTKSTAFDLGMVLGLDIEIQKGFEIGLQYRFFRNIQKDSPDLPISMIDSDSDRILENRNYNIVSLSGKAYF